MGIPHHLVGACKLDQQRWSENAAESCTNYSYAMEVGYKSPTLNYNLYAKSPWRHNCLVSTRTTCRGPSSHSPTKRRNCMKLRWISSCLHKSRTPNYVTFHQDQTVSHANARTCFFCPQQWMVLDKRPVLHHQCWVWTIPNGPKSVQ